jgi:hypothetical protein
MRKLLFALVLSGLIAAPALACGPAVKGGSSGPPIAAALDDLLPKAELPAADLEKVRGLRAEIATLVASNNMREARHAEEQAMAILGYREALTRCGPGSFLWSKRG